MEGGKTGGWEAAGQAPSPLTGGPTGIGGSKGGYVGWQPVSAILGAHGGDGLVNRLSWDDSLSVGTKTSKPSIQHAKHTPALRPWGEKGHLAVFMASTQQDS